MSKKYKFNKTKLMETIGCLLIGSGFAMALYYMVVSPELFFTTTR